MENCGNRPPKCIICAGPHKVEKHCCGVAGYNKGKGKSCVHDTAKCANCGGIHVAYSPRYVSRHKADIKARKEKKTKEKKGKEKVQEDGVSNEIEEKRREDNVSNKAEEERRETSPQLETEMDLEDERWAQGSKVEASDVEEDESQNHSKEF